MASFISFMALLTCPGFLYTPSSSKPLSSTISINFLIPLTAASVSTPAGNVDSCGKWRGRGSGEAGEVERRGKWRGGGSGEAGAVERRGQWRGGGSGEAGAVERREKWRGGGSGEAGKVER